MRERSEESYLENQALSVSCFSGPPHTHTHTHTHTHLHEPTPTHTHTGTTGGAQHSVRTRPAQETAGTVVYSRLEHAFLSWPPIVTKAKPLILSFISYQLADESDLFKDQLMEAQETISHLTNEVRACLSCDVMLAHHPP